MKDFLDMLQEAFPALKSHPRLMLATFLIAVLIVALYSAKERRSQFCERLYSAIYAKVFTTQRWLYVFQGSNIVNEWKYYTSEVIGRGRVGDDVVWTLVTWPQLKPLDSFRVTGAVGMVDGIYKSQSILQGRWGIAHNPDVPGVGPIPARGIRSWIHRTVARLLIAVARL